MYDKRIRKFVAFSLTDGAYSFKWTRKCTRPLSCMNSPYSTTRERHSRCGNIRIVWYGE